MIEGCLVDGQKGCRVLGENADRVGDRLEEESVPLFRAEQGDLGALALHSVANDSGVTTGLTSPSLPYFAVKPFILLRDVEVPEGIPLAVEVGGS